MENTLENKARFFSQFYRQHVFYNSLGAPMAGFEVLRREFIAGVKAKLKPIETIRPREGHKLAEIFNESRSFISYYSKDSLIIRLDESTELYIGFDGEITITNETEVVSPSSLEILEAYDLLRSMEFAVPWNGLSVNQQIEYGWIFLNWGES